MGATELNPDCHLDINSLIQKIFVNEFQNTSPLITQVYSIKFLSTFRLQIEQQALSTAFSMLVNLLSNFPPAIKTAALLCLDKMLVMKSADRTTYLSKTVVNNQQTFGSLVQAIAPILQSEYDFFAMRCFYRILLLTDYSYYSSICRDLAITMNNILTNIIKKPTEGEFNYYFFETLCLIVNKLAKCQNPNNLKLYESTLANNFNVIMQRNDTDLMAYSVQFSSSYLFKSKDTSDYYKGLLNNVLNKDSWNIQMKFMFNPFIDYLKVNFMNGSSLINDNTTPQRILDICNRLHDFKAYKELFNFLDFLIYYQATVVKNTGGYFNLVANLLSTAVQTLKNPATKTNPIAYRQLGAYILVLYEKLAINLNMESTMNFVNMNGIELLTEMVDLVDFIEPFRNKKLAMDFYCNVLANYSSSFKNENIQYMVGKLCFCVKNFYKVNFDTYTENLEDNITYTANNFNILTNASIVIPTPMYDELFKSDVNVIFFKAMNTLSNAKSFNYVTEAIKAMKKRDQENFKSIANKYNFSC